MSLILKLQLHLALRGNHSPKLQNIYGLVQPAFSGHFITKMAAGSGLGPSMLGPWDECSICFVQVNKQPTYLARSKVGIYACIVKVSKLITYFPVFFGIAT